MNSSTPTRFTAQRACSLGTGPALVLAAKSGDEVAGCGAVCRRYVDSGGGVTVVIATDGRSGIGEPKERTELRQQAESESCAAARILGYPEPVFWREPASSIVYGETLVQRIGQLLEKVGAKLLFAPSVYSTDPTRSTLGLAAREAARRATNDCRLAMYEIGVPFQPNRILDMADVLVHKEAAMACFGWHLDRESTGPQSVYLDRTQGEMQAQEIQPAEAFTFVDEDELFLPITGIAARWTGRRESLASEALVSVIIRTTNRPELADALDSIAAQTYRCIEVVLVDVEGKGLLSAGSTYNAFPIRVASTGEHLGRGAAANAGLAAAVGVFVVFLDDDDWFLPDHVSTLVSAVQGSTSAHAAYSGIQCRTLDDSGRWKVLYTFNDPFDPTRLMVQNYLPMHAVLFERVFLGDQVRFDETLDVYEDWDFWVQLSHHSHFVHIDRITAIYRISSTGGFGVRAEDPQVLDGLRKFFEKWRLRWRPEQIIAIARYTNHRTPIHNPDAQPADAIAELGPLGGCVTEQADLIRQLQVVADEHIASLERLTGISATYQRNIARLESSLKDITAQLRASNEALLAEREGVAVLRGALARNEASVMALGSSLAATQDLAESCMSVQREYVSRLSGLQATTTWPVTRRLLQIEARFPGVMRGFLEVTRVAWWAVTLSLPAALRRRAQARRIALSGLFDESWYVQKYPDVALSGHLPLYHWMSIGWREGRKPHPLFETGWYLSQDPEIVDSGLNPLLHYLDQGAGAGLDPYPLFDSDWYLEKNPDVAAIDANPLVHFLEQGARDGRDPHPMFSIAWYLHQYPDVAALGINPLIHYEEHGKQEGRATHPPNVHTSDVRLSLDSVDGDSIRACEAVYLHGWLIARGGVAIAKVLIDSRECMSLEPTLERPDVQAAHPKIADTLMSGFDVRIDLAGLAPGDHVLTIAVRSRLGSELIHDVRLVIEESRERWHLAYYRHQPDPSTHQALAAQVASWDQRPRLAALISCRLGFPERLLGDLAAQVLTPERVLLLPGSASTSLTEIEWKTSAWIELHPDVSFGVDVRSPAAAVTELGSSVDYVLLLDAGDRLTRDALFHLARETLERPVDLVYCDHDLIGDDYLHVEPSLKPAWSPSLLLNRDYIEGCLLVSADRLDAKAVGLCGSPTWRYRQALAGSSVEAAVHHVPRVLWSKPVGTMLEQPSAAAVAEAWISSLEPRAVVTIDPLRGDRRVRWPLPDQPPKVSIVIPTTGRPDFLIPCVTSLAEHTAYPDYELIFLDNGRGQYPEGIAWLQDKGLKVIECNEPFNWSRLNNRGAHLAQGEYLLFLNDDIEVTEPEWLDWLVSHATRPGVGCVGALLYYPSGEIQHDGVFLVDHGGGVRHWFHRMPPGSEIYQRLDLVTREVTAVTGACMLVSTGLFRELGGFDEGFVITHNDVDFCLRVAERGLRNLVVADTSLIHHESVHRGNKSSPQDDERMWEIRGDDLRHGDLYHNPQLVKTSVRCEVDYQRSVDSTEIKTDAGTGINCIAYVTAEMGLGEAARGILAALESAGMTADAIDYRRGNPSRCADRRWAHRMVSECRQPVSLYIVNADWLPTVKADVRKQLPRERYAIGYWAWELSEFPTRWERSFDLVDEVWVASEHVRAGVQRLTAKPVRVVPNPVELDAIDLPARDDFGLPANCFLFLALFDVHSNVARKNPIGAIDAFRHAFSPDDDRVHLVVKVNNADASTLQQLEAHIHGRRNVTILDRVLTRREVNGLFNSCDALVSLHRAEGFGLPPAEAMWLGKPVIATNYSGNTDFMNESNSMLIPYRVVRIGVDQGPYDKDLVWAEPDLPAAAAAMRRLAQDSKLCDMFGRAAWRSVRAQLAPAVVGRQIAEILTSIKADAPAE